MSAKVDIAASIRQRLLNRARETGQDFQRLLVRYGVERLLYRLSRSEDRERFVLKGAMLFAAWADAPFRSTGDLDLLGIGSDDIEAARTTFARLCAADVGDEARDGLIFDGTNIRVERTRAEEEYQGLHVRLDSLLKTTRIPLQIDIGFGDAITPAPMNIDYPNLLSDIPAANIRAYPPETVIAEKFDAMILFDEANTRLKDHYDIWAIAHTFPFDLENLVGALRATLDRRQRVLPDDWPACLRPAFAERPDKLRQWQAFLQRTAPSLMPPPFPDVLAELRAFLEPVVTAARASEPVPALRWRAERGWVSADTSNSAI
jgi:hypothetical protein